ncbi:MAG: diguanylate cyclase domain-containing protein [Blautia marasmi]
MQTGVYNKDTAIQMIGDALLKNHSKGQSYALLVFNVDYFTRLVQEIGYVAADDVLKKLATRLR